MEFYKINEVRQFGTIYKQIKLQKKSFGELKLTWRENDIETERKCFKTADKFVIRHGLNYKTRRLKRLNGKNK